MIIGFTGPLGSGKTLGMTVWAWYLSAKARGVPIFANYALRPAYFRRHQAVNPAGFRMGYVKGAADLIEMVEAGGGILLLDELHRMLDSRLSIASVNIYLSQFFMYLRKLGITCLLASQHELNFDRRVRNVLDLMINCRKTPEGFSYTLIDHQGRQILGHRFLPLKQAEKFRGAYDTYELIKGFTFPGTQKAFDKFLADLDSARARRRLGGAPFKDLDAEFLASLEAVEV